MVSGRKRQPKKKSAGSQPASDIISAEKACRTIDKNSKTMTKLLALQDIVVSLRNADAGVTTDDSCRTLELRIDRLKSRVHRRLRTLARWIDIPAAKRLPPPVVTAMSNVSSRAALRSLILSPALNIFVPDHNVQRGAILPRLTNLDPSRIGHPNSANIARCPDDKFVPGNQSIFQQANGIVSMQKKILADAMQSISSVTSTIKSNVALTGVAEAVNVTLPTAKRVS